MENIKMSSFMSPTLGMGFGVAVVVSLVISALGLIGAPSADFVMVSLFVFIGLVLAAVLLYIATRLVKVPNASFAKMIVLSAFVSFVTHIAGLLLGFAGLSAPIILLINIIIVIALIRWYFQISVPKALGILVVEIVIGFIVGAIIFFTVGPGALKMFTNGMDKLPVAETGVIQGVSIENTY